MFRLANAGLKPLPLTPGTGAVASVVFLRLCTPSTRPRSKEVGPTFRQSQRYWDLGQESAETLDALFVSDPRVPSLEADVRGQDGALDKVKQALKEVETRCDAATAKVDRAVTDAADKRSLWLTIGLAAVAVCVAFLSLVVSVWMLKAELGHEDAGVRPPAAVQDGDAGATTRADGDTGGCVGTAALDDGGGARGHQAAQ